MRFRPAGGLDLTTGALILGGACLVAISIVVALVALAPPPMNPGGPTAFATEVPTVGARASAALTGDQVAAVLNVETAAGAGALARAGDHVDVLGYFSRQITGNEAVTRVLVKDAPVLTVARSGSDVALTLALPHASAVLLQEARALGARPYVTLRARDTAADPPAMFSDSDLAKRLAGVGR